MSHKKSLRSINGNYQPVFMHFTPHSLFQYSQYHKAKSFLGRLSRTNRPPLTFQGLWVSLVLRLHTEKGCGWMTASFLCWPNLISGSEYGTMFPATVDGITFSRASKTSLMRLIHSVYITICYDPEAVRGENRLKVEGVWKSFKKKSARFRCTIKALSRPCICIYE